MRFNGTDADGKRIVGVGITRETYEEMLRGQAMVVDLEQLGVPGAKLVILAGSNDVALTKDIQRFIGERTKVYVDLAAIIQKGTG